MKKTTIILGLISMITLCLSACGKPNVLTFEEALDSISYSEFNEIMNSAEIYEQDFKISSNFSGKDNSAKASFSINSKNNKKDSEWETKITLKVNVSWSWEKWKENTALDWNATIRYLPYGIYFKLNSLNIDGLENSMNDSNLNLSWVVNKWFSFELTGELLDKIRKQLPEDFDSNKNYNNKENLQKLKNSLKKVIKNEWSVVYSGLYSEFKGCKARKISIDKEKLINTIKDYIQSQVPEEEMDDFNQSFNEMDFNEIFKDIPFKNFKWYLVITKKGMAQIVIENLDIINENALSTAKIRGTFGNDRYELVIKQNGKDVIFLSAKLNKNHYDIILRSSGKKILRWTITPKKSKWKIGVLFDLYIGLELDENMRIPLNGSWSRKEISKFKVKAPSNSKNLLEDLIKDMDEDFDISSYQFLAWGMDNHNFMVPIIAGGIMTAALMPRMQSAQNRARDVSRKVDLSQIQSAIVTSQWDKWMWPGMDKGATKWVTISSIEKEIQEAWMSSVPKDPNNYNINYWLWQNYKNDSVMGEYLYLVTKRNWVQNGWFVLMAKTEEEWWSNRVVCKDGTWIDKWYILSNTDIAKINTCTDISKGNSCEINEWTCTYTDDDELRFILMY